MRLPGKSCLNEATHFHRGYRREGARPKNNERRLVFEPAEGKTVTNVLRTTHFSVAIVMMRSVLLFASRSQVLSFVARKKMAVVRFVAWRV